MTLFLNPKIGLTIILFSLYRFIDAAPSLKGVFFIICSLILIYLNQKIYSKKLFIYILGLLIIFIFINEKKRIEELSMPLKLNQNNNEIYLNIFDKEKYNWIKNHYLEFAPDCYANTINCFQNSHIDNSTEYCLEPIDSYCSDSTYFEYYIDYSVSFDPYIGNIKDDSKCLTLIVPGCMDETMFNYDDNANVNQFSIEDTLDPCYPIVIGCLDESAANFNNYYSNLNINPQTGLTYESGDIELLDFGANQGQDSVFTNYFNYDNGNGINVNTKL